ncbi:hypothetical protein G6O69_37155 [Pseudenhygromyxa sp. WMMC2535]|uniref:hypothetical protein n=1 Tax=Pseudenhygromyxa sp. WMMC2535 TaxID=2712867 RepID=UPI001553BA9F|nr:hypothetical protein [Pseudenhygromyxa sp. WMMC2535]NVB40308.1 hypothetical protein [Pseudenhygromyxa sp. WMMC2535]NVB43507.1 hypothetical protein [Pseudenhygromyxa sp. WMMC2535]
MTTSNDMPIGSWTQTSVRSFISSYSGQSVFTTLSNAGQNNNDLYVSATAAFNDGDEFANMSGGLQMTTVGSKTKASLPQGTWAKTAYNTVWCQASYMFQANENFPFVRDCSGNLQPLNTAGLIYLSSVITGTSNYPQNCFALPTATLSNQGSTFVASQATPQAYTDQQILKAIEKKNLGSGYWPKGDWSSSAEQSSVSVIDYCGNYLIGALLKQANGDSRAAFATFCQGDSFSNNNGYFQLTPGNTTKAQLPQGSWVETAFDLIWAPSKQILVSSANTRSFLGTNINAGTPYATFISFFPASDGSPCTQTGFGTVPLNLSNQSGVLVPQSESSSSSGDGWLMKALKWAAHEVVSEAESEAESALQSAASDAADAAVAALF